MSEMAETNDITLQLLLPREQHESYFATTLQSAFATSAKADVILVCQGKKVRAHRTILAATSPLLAHILRPLYYSDLIHVVLDGFNPIVLPSLIEFIYHGTATVAPGMEEAFKELLLEFEIGSSTNLTTIESPSTLVTPPEAEQDTLQSVEEEDEEEDDIMDDGQIEEPNDDADFTPASSSKPVKNGVATKRSRRAIKQENGSSDSNLFTCQHCGVKFSRRSSLTMHMRLHNDERPFVCGICYKRFRQSGHLRTHERIHTGEKPFQCDVCSKVFSHASTLAEHKNLHTWETVYTCDLCHRTFPQRRGLHKHACDRGNANANSIQCSKCPRTFPNAASFKSHYSQVHSPSSTPIAEDSVSYLCLECSEVLRTEPELMQHTMQIHGATSYACRRCKVDFETVSSFDSHVCDA